MPAHVCAGFNVVVFQGVVVSVIVVLMELGMSSLSAQSGSAVHRQPATLPSDL